MGRRQRARGHGSGRLHTPRFFAETELEHVPPGTSVRLGDGEDEHARRTLRLAAGDRVELLDGRGGWVHAELSEERGLARTTAEVERESAPGERGARLPRIELFVAPPRGARFDGLLDGATQLGVSAIRPLVCERTGPQERAARRNRQVRILRESCKQSGRVWIPELHDAVPVIGSAASVRGPLVLLDPRAGRTLLDVAAELDADPWIGLAVGPEGGFTLEERAALEVESVRAARLGPHILRIETAALAALGVLTSR